MYTGFWRRFVAYLIDYALLTLVIYILALILGMTAGIGSAAAGVDESGLAALMSVFGGFFIMLFILLPWLYYSLMESSAKQATLGKIVLGIRVVDYEGRRISFGRATGRYFAKIISSLILLIGFIIAGFTSKKQALHDYDCRYACSERRFYARSRRYRSLNKLWLACIRLPVSPYPKYERRMVETLSSIFNKMEVPVMKKILGIFLSFAILMFLPGYMYAAEKPVEVPDIKFIVNNRPTRLEDVPLGIGGRTLLPLRATLVSLGVPDDNEHIRWDGKEKSVTVISGSNIIYLKLDSKTALINNKTVALDAAPLGYARNQRVYIPVRFISNALGMEVAWDGGSRTVFIKDSDKFAEMKSILNKIEEAMSNIDRARINSRMELNNEKQGAKVKLDISLREELDKKAGLLRSVTEMPLFGGNFSFSAFYKDNTKYINEVSGGSWEKTPLKESDFKALLSEDISLKAINSMDVMAASLEKREGQVKGEYLLTGALYPARLASNIGKNAGIVDFTPESCSFEASLDSLTNLVKKIHAEFRGKAGPVNSRSAVTAVVDAEYSDYDGTFEIKIPEDLPE